MLDESDVFLYNIRKKYKHMFVFLNKQGGMKEVKRNIEEAGNA